MAKSKLLVTRVFFFPMFASLPTYGCLAIDGKYGGWCHTWDDMPCQWDLFQKSNAVVKYGK